MVSSPANAQITEADTGWPREIVTDSGTMIIYQPQPDKLDGITLTGRAAVSVLPTGSKEPVFGVVWFTSRAQTDRDDRTVDTRVGALNIVSKNRQQSGWAPARSIASAARASRSISLTASLAEAAAEQRSADSLNTTPPAIIFSSSPAALLLFDGQPLLQKVENSQLQRAVNTPMLVLFDAKEKTYYLNGGPLWYSAGSALGPWTSQKGKIPADVAALVPDSVQSASPPPGGPPAIVVATSPTELIVTEGPAKWAPVTGTDLLYVTNTDRDVFRTLDSPQMYVLLAGRWFRARTDAGPWTLVRPDALPADFAKIPSASPRADVLASVPGTTQADEALMDTQIPQTAAIDRKTATLTVSYAGAPVFKQVTGTSVAYATNTDTQVLRINDMYYACDQAVWFVSKSAKGPWVVSDSVPKAVQTIPPSSPVYNVKYVQVYQATPPVVYVGYTPGYTWAFPYYGTVVYGTGYVTLRTYPRGLLSATGDVRCGGAIQPVDRMDRRLRLRHAIPVRRCGGRTALLRWVVWSVWTAAISAAVLPAAVPRCPGIDRRRRAIVPRRQATVRRREPRAPRRMRGKATCTGSRRTARATRRHRRLA